MRHDFFAIWNEYGQKMSAGFFSRSEAQACIQGKQNGRILAREQYWSGKMEHDQ